VNDLETKTRNLMIVAVLTMAALSGVAVMAYANNLASNSGILATFATDSTAEASTATNMTRGEFGGFGFGRPGHGRGCGPPFTFTVSEEYKTNVITVAENDTDVQALMAEGYNVTDVRPIIETIVEADGTVTMKATTAIVALVKDTTGRAMVWVDIESVTVTRIEIHSITIIDKSS
jgi:hypothetical protein